MTNDQTGSFSLGRFRHQDGDFLGLVVAGRVHRVDEIEEGQFRRGIGLRDLLDDWALSFEALRRATLALPADGGVPVDGLKALAPLPDARQVFCCGANYAKHVKQMMLATNVHPGLTGLDDAGRDAFAQAFVEQQARESDPYIFMKTVTSICGPDATVDLPAFSRSIDWELELAVVFGREAHLETADSALSAIAGYMVANDLTARDKVRRTDPGSIGADWVMGKGAPGFLPTGPYFVPAAFIPDPLDLEMRLSVNGTLRQHANTGEMTFDLVRQIVHLTGYAKLMPGDILCTGTPDGNAVADGSFLQDGDVVEADIALLGAQRVTFRRTV